jgi:hypothetical protein
MHARVRRQSRARPTGFKNILLLCRVHTTRQFLRKKKQNFARWSGVVTSAVPLQHDSTRASLASLSTDSTVSAHCARALHLGTGRVVGRRARESREVGASRGAGPGRAVLAKISRAPATGQAPFAALRCPYRRLLAHAWPVVAWSRAETRRESSCCSCAANSYSLSTPTRWI